MAKKIHTYKIHTHNIYEKMLKMLGLNINFSTESVTEPINL